MVVDLVNKKIMKNIWRIALVLFLILSPLKTLAAGDGEMAIYPENWDGVNELTKHWFIYDLGPGGTTNSSVVVENMGDGDLSVKIYAVDAETTADGAFALKNEDEEKTDIGGWVKLAEKELTLAPKEKKSVAFTIAIPQEVEPGEHMGGIVIENKEIAKGQLLNIKTRVGVRIYETVPGEIIKKLNFSGLDVEGFYSSIWSLFYDWKAKYSLNNEGNVQAVPTIEAHLTSPIFGEVFSKSEKLNGTIFPKKSVEPVTEITKPLYFGPYTLTLNAQQDGQTVPTQHSISFWVWPWKLVLLIIIVILALWSLFYLDRGKKEKEEGPTQFIISSEESINKKKRNTKTVKKNAKNKATKSRKNTK
jgi:hypothetical protein